MSEHETRQEFEMKASEEELQCTDPRCIRIFAHRAHTSASQPVVRRDRA